MTSAVPFLKFWQDLNIKLQIRDEPEALFGEAKRWYDLRVVKTVDDRLVNQIVNERKPL